MGDLQRMLSRYDGDARGPLLICLGGMHGNEPAGVEAIRVVSVLLEEEPNVNPTFTFHGRFIGLAGNLGALAQARRFIRTDMNRILKPDFVQQLLHSGPDGLNGEAREAYELVMQVRQEIAEYQPEKVVVLDIHTTSADGGIFVIASDDEESIRIGAALHAPVVLDFAREVHGTTLGYFNKENFAQDITTVVFESGQHSAPLSVNRAIAAIVNCMRTIGCVAPDAVEHKHDRILQEYSRGLPKVSRVVERFGIPQGSTFRIARKYQNFERVTAGETLAFLDDTPIQADHDGLILLPRLQDEGDDGYFIVQPVMTPEPA